MRCLTLRQVTIQTPDVAQVRTTSNPSPSLRHLKMSARVWSWNVLLPTFASAFDPFVAKLDCGIRSRFEFGLTAGLQVHFFDDLAHDGVNLGAVGR